MEFEGNWRSDHKYRAILSEKRIHVIETKTRISIMIKFPKILPEPALPAHLPSTAKWLSGEGAGSWFVIEQENDIQYKITRFSPEGLVECEGLFGASIANMNIEKDFEITYPSHCAKVSIIQGEEKIIFNQVL